MISITSALDARRLFANPRDNKAPQKRRLSCRHGGVCFLGIRGRNASSLEAARALQFAEGLPLDGDFSHGLCLVPAMHCRLKMRIAFVWMLCEVDVRWCSVWNTDDGCQPHAVHQRGSLRLGIPRVPRLVQCREACLSSDVLYCCSMRGDWPGSESRAVSFMHLFCPAPQSARSPSRALLHIAYMTPWKMVGSPRSHTEGEISFDIQRPPKGPACSKTFDASMALPPTPCRSISKYAHSLRHR